jgi:hypothetical protein
MAFPSLARAAVLAAVVTAALARPARAQHFTDTAMSGWSSLNVLPSQCPNLVVSNPASPGHSTVLAFTQSACGTPQFATHWSPFSWNPSTQGAISAMTVGWEARWTAGSFQGDTRIGTAFIIRQAGATYYAVPPIANFGTVSSSSWSQFTAVLSSLTWCDYTGFTCPAAVPDFSATGGAIDFGLATANYCPGCGKTLSGELDNFDVDLQVAPPVTTAPEPASLALVASGLAGIGAVARRKTRR